MGFVIIPLFYAGSQFALHPLDASAVPSAGAPQRLLLRHGRRSATAALRDGAEAELYLLTGASSAAVVWDAQSEEERGFESRSGFLVIQVEVPSLLLEQSTWCDIVLQWMDG